MLRLTLGLCATVATVLIASACGSEPPVPTEEVALGTDEIVGGSADTGAANDAVVFIQGNGGACTATIIAKNGSTGYALTAGHCAGGGGPTQLWIGGDLDNPKSVHPITQVVVHPSYNGNNLSYDFALLRFSGANAGTPVIPAATPADDNLTINSQLEHVGYGLYNCGGSQLCQSDIRRHAFGNVDGLTSLFIDYDQSWSGNPGGPCNGDSGGPQLAGGRVVGVTSNGDQFCQQYGSSGRVSAVYNSFIAPFIGGQPGPVTCDECAASAQNPGGACAGAVDACGANQQCVDLIGCINNCTTDACVQNCANQYPNGVASYNALIGCICDVGCVTECASVCGGSSSTTTSGPGGVTSVTTGAGAGPGVGGGAVTGAGGAGTGTGTETGAGAGSAKNSDDDDDDKKSSSCAVSTPGGAGDAPVPTWFMAAALLGLGAMARRRRALS